MWRTNAGLVESHAWDSRPGDWPWLRRGINFWFGLYRQRSLTDRGKDHRQVYLIGNPAIWWTTTIAIASYLVIKGLSVLRWQRGYKDYTNGRPFYSQTNSSNMETLRLGCWCYRSRLGFALPSLLPYETPTLPPPLLPSSLFWCSCTLSRMGLSHHTSTFPNDSSSSIPNHSPFHRRCNRCIRSLSTSCLWWEMD